MDIGAAIARGEAIPSELVGALEDHSALLADGKALRARLTRKGYLYLPKYLSRADVMAARREIFGKLAAMGEIQEPVEAGVFTGSSRRRELVADLGAYWRSVTECWSLRRLTHGPALSRLMELALGSPARAQDFVYLRCASPGKFTNLHCDYAFFTHCTESVLTAWMALGDIPLAHGPLFLVENSHRFEDIIARQKGIDVTGGSSRPASGPVPPLQFIRQRATRLLTRNFQAGDVVIFSMFTVHGSLDNVSSNRVRLSADLRYQPMIDEMDPRFFGPDPCGMTGAGYGELMGAKPMTEPWHSE